MKIDRRRFIRSALLLAAGGRAIGSAKGMPAAPAFAPTWESLAGYSAPPWFRDAKLGFSAYWGPPSVPEMGDWYARNLYIEGSPHYLDHLRRYGHPSEFGYKDLCRIWSGRDWEPGRLMDRFHDAGGRYFMALANHHDGFDCWNSRHQPWNSVRIGARRDVVGEWAAAARARGLRFGALVFAAQNWDWMSPSHGADREGPYKGKPYDGSLTAALGAGTWWEGLDPRGLYAPPHAAGVPPSEEYIANFFARTRDLVQQHRPDQIFFTEHGLPFGREGLRFVAEFYNAGMGAGGATEAVVNTKHMQPGLSSALVWDRLPPADLAPDPWQMDICIGDWRYRRGMRYRPAADVVPYLVDTVSKNGNLLVNVPLDAGGGVDEGEKAFLADMAAWTKVNGEAVFGTRPWTVFGEGPAGAPQVDFPYWHVRYGPEDIRFTTRGNALYAIALGWPDRGELTIRSLSAGSPRHRRPIGRVVLLGEPAALRWNRNASGLSIRLPERRPCEHAWAFRIE